MIFRTCGVINKCMKIDLSKSRIIAKKSLLHNHAVHIDCELWGHTDRMAPTEPVRLLNFYKQNSDFFGVAPQDSTDKLELVPAEEFSAQLWRVKIQDDWDKLTDVQEIKIYTQIMTTGKMFFTLRFD